MNEAFTSMNGNYIIYKSYDNVSQSKKSQVIQMKNKSKVLITNYVKSRDRRERHIVLLYI